MAFPGRCIVLSFVVLASFLSVGFVHGLWTDRWVSRGASHDELVAEMEKVPLTFGAWEGKTVYVSSHPLLPDATNFALRRYVNQKDGTALQVMLTRGRPGPMVIKHLPTECYPSSGFEVVEPPKRFFSEATGKVTDEFWVATFKKTAEVVPTIVRVYWSWTGTGRWQTPPQPRIAFAHDRVLYKLYVVRPLLHEDDEVEASPVHDFIRVFGDAMRKSFFPSVVQ
jgi:hypothetical protein